MTRIIRGDCLEVMPSLPAQSIDTILTDSPYGLEFMGKEWDTFRASNSGIKKSGFEKLGKNGTPSFSPNHRNQKCPVCGKWAYDYPDRKCTCGGWKQPARLQYSRRFQEWSTMWAVQAFRVAKPGAILMAFGGTRTFHRLACAIEDAGWEIRDCMMWLTGQGFPKSKQFGCKCGGIDANSSTQGRRGGICPKCGGIIDFRGYGTGLKPAWEPIIVAMKPLEGTYAENAQKWGVAGLWIDGGRIPTGENASQSGKVLVPSISGGVACDSLESWRDWLLHMLSVLRPCSIDGTIHEHSSDGQDGKLLAGALCDALQGFHSANATWCGLKPSEVLGSRFDYQPCLHFCDGLVHQVQVAAQESAPSLADALERICRCLLEPSRSRDIDNDHLSNEDVSLCILALCRLLYSIWYPTPQYTLPPPSCQAKGRFPANLLLDEESARLLGGASRFFYTSKASSSERNAGLEDMPIGQTVGGGGMNNTPDDVCGKYGSVRAPQHNVHPTVKPVDLMRYLCKLTRTPTGGVVLDPFAGSGTTGIACILEHRDFIGIELSPDYANIARKRIDDMIGPLFVTG